MDIIFFFYALHKCRKHAVLTRYSFQVEHNVYHNMLNYTEHQYWDKKVKVLSVLFFLSSRNVNMFVRLYQIYMFHSTNII